MVSFWIIVIQGTINYKSRGLSNRAIKVVINNLKGIFFKHDDFEHMACGIEAHWVKTAGRRYGFASWKT